MVKERHIDALLAVFFVLLVLGVLVHQDAAFAGSPAGHLVGVTGAALMSMALIYPFRKRVLGKRGKANPLGRHMTYGLLGPSLVVIHSAHKLESLIGILAFTAMFLVVTSGIIGMFLFQRVNRSVKEQTKDLKALRELFFNRRKEIASCRVYLDLETAEEPGSDGNTSGGHEFEDRLLQDRCHEAVDLAHAIAELEYSLRVFNKTQALFGKWIWVHYALALFLFSLLAVHILSAFYYGVRWL
jgi:hypothetical protein